MDVYALAVPDGHGFNGQGMPISLEKLKRECRRFRGKNSENRGYILYGVSDRHRFSTIHYLNAYFGYHTYDLEQVPCLHNLTAIVDPCSHSITRKEKPQPADKHPLE